MIRFRDTILEDFFIDPVTAIITNSKGEIQKTKIISGRPYFKGMFIHVIQAHTHYGYKQGFDVHHLDKNKMNNSLSNLVYLTRSEHIRLHKKGKHHSEKTKRISLDEVRLKKIKLYREKYKEATGEFCSMGKFVENLIDKFCQLNLELLIQKHKEDEKNEEELLSIIEEEFEKIVKENKIGGN